MGLSWCGADNGEGQLINSCALYTYVFWIPALIFIVIFITRSVVISAYMHFPSLDKKNEMILFLFQLLSGLCALLSIILFWSSDQTSLALLVCCALQAAVWTLCLILTTRECWRETEWPSHYIKIYLYCATFISILQVLTINNSATQYSHNMVKTGTAQAAVSALLTAFVSFKGHLFSPEEKERLELDRVSVDLFDGRSPFRSSMHGESPHVNPLLGGSFLARLIGVGGVGGGGGGGGGGKLQGKAIRRSSSGLSLKNWIGSNEDDSEGYTAISGESDDWVGNRVLSDDGNAGNGNETQSVVLSALEKNNQGQGYNPPDDMIISGDDSDVKESACAFDGTNSNQSQTVMRAMQGHTARIAAAGAFTTISSTESSNNRAHESISRNPQPSWLPQNTPESYDAEYYTIAAVKWSLRHSDVVGVNNDEIEFEIVVKVQQTGQVQARGDWRVSPDITAEGNSSSNATCEAKSKWSVWRTGAELMSLHSQLVMIHGEAAAPRRPKLKSMQLKGSQKSGHYANFSRSNRSASTDRAPSKHFLSDAATYIEDEAISHADITSDLRVVSIYLMAVLAIANKSVHLNASFGEGNSVRIPAGGLRNIYPALLNFLELYVEGSKETNMVIPEKKSSRSNSFTEGHLRKDDVVVDEEMEEKEKWRKLFAKLKAKVVLQNQCIRCRLFTSCIRGSDIHNFLQVANEGFLKDDEALSMGSLLIQCGLLRAVVVGHHGPSAQQVAAASTQESEVSDNCREGFSSGSSKPGDSDAHESVRFADDPNHLYTFPEIFKMGAGPNDRFSLFGGLSIELDITNTETTSDGSVRYCLSLKHVSTDDVNKIDRKYNSSGSDRWVSWKRYSEFDSLHNALCSYGFCPPAPLPPKTLSMATVGAVLSSTSVSTAGSDPRRDGLESYLRSAIKHIMSADLEVSDHKDAPSRNSESMFDSIAFLETNRGTSLSDAKDVLANFLDVDHSHLTIW